MAPSEVIEMFQNEHAVAFKEKLKESDKGIVLITHKNCNDGYGCACLYLDFLSKFRPDIEPKIIYIQYANNLNLDDYFMPIDIEDKLVIIADFSFELKHLEVIDNIASDMILIDHHDSAAKLLPNVPKCYINQEMSGAGLFEYFLFPTRTPNPLIAYIQDRDIWTWRLPDSKEVNAGISLYSHQDHFKTAYDASSYHGSDFIAGVKLIGTGILDYQNNHINKVTSSNKIKMVKWGNLTVPFINTTTLISEIGNELAKVYPFAIMYFITGTEIVFSFRSTDMNLLKLGVPRGHKAAAGRSIPLKDINLNYLFATEQVGEYLTVLFNAFPVIEDDMFYILFGCNKIQFILQQANKRVHLDSAWAGDFIQLHSFLKENLFRSMDAQVYFKRLYKDIETNVDEKYRTKVIADISKLITYLNYLLFPRQPEQTDSGNGGHVSRSNVFLKDIKNEKLQEDISSVEELIDSLMIKHGFKKSIE